jgi:hypothetical protein
MTPCRARPASAMSLPDNPENNHLLAALPAAEFRQLAPHLERFPMRLGASNVMGAQSARSESTGRP